MPTVMESRLICRRVKSRDILIITPGTCWQSTEKILVFIFSTYVSIGSSSFPPDGTIGSACSSGSIGMSSTAGLPQRRASRSFGAISPGRYEDYIEDIYKSGEHLLSLINDVLDMAKIESGKFELTCATLYLAQVAEHALLFVAPQAQTAQLNLEAKIAAELSLVADERAIRQILTNLLSNAVKFTKPGGTVRIFAEPMAEGQLALGVEDTGIGMTPAGIAVALEPFGQVNSDLTVEGAGTGLGLPIVKSLIEAHGAAFHIESAPGKGTRVWGEFPARDVNVKRGAA